MNTVLHALPWLVAAITVLVALLRVTRVLPYVACMLTIQNISDNASAGLMDWYSMVYDDAAWRDNVFLSLVTKERGGGQQVKQAIKIARSAGHGADITQAINNASSEVRKAFFTPWAKSYVVENVDNTEIDVSEEDDGAIVEILGDAMEGCMRKANEDLELDCFSDGFASRGTIASHVNGPPIVLTLDSQASVLKWQVGDVGVSDDTVNSGALDAGSFTVTAIDTDALTITVTSNGGWAAVDTHFLFAAADKIAGSLTSPIKVLGLKFWIPATAPSGTDATGIDRGTDPNKLAGVRLPNSVGLPPSTAVNKLLTQISLNKSARPNVVMCPPGFFADFQDELQGKAVYAKSEGTGAAAGVYFDGIEVQGPKGKAVVHAAPGCDSDRIYALDMRTWILRSPKNKPVKMAGRAGKDGLIDSQTADSVQIRMKYVANLSCSFPGANGVAKIA